MKVLLICVALLLMGLANPSFAQQREALGWGYLLSNDVIGDTKDRWRTGSIVLSHVRGPSWTGVLPGSFGALIEYRFRGEVISPERLAAPAATDRRYVGALSFGAHSYWQQGGAELALGLDLIFVGPQTKLDDFQGNLHDIFGGPQPNVSNFQVENAIYPTVTFEAGRRFRVSQNGTVRPFLELQAGAETLARIGVDVTIGTFGQGGLLVRDTGTGQRYLGISGPQPEGLSFVLGGDLAYVADSRYLATPGVVAEDWRGRLRAGYHRGWKRAGLFYGVTYLSEEFKAQRKGQFVGSVSARYQF